MRTLMLIWLALLASAACGQTGPSTTHQAFAVTHRYIIERTFKPGALDNLDAAAKAKVNANNDKSGVRWLLSYANASRTKTYCIYEGPSEQAIRNASSANGLPIDAIMEVPVTLLPQ